MSNRFPLGNDEEVYLEVEDSVDPLNLHSYDAFDWTTLILTQTLIALIFFGIGWCLHKMCVYNKLYGNTEADIETLVAKMSFTNTRSHIFTNPFHLPSLRHNSSKGSNNSLPKLNPAFNGIASIAETKDNRRSTKLKAPAMAITVSSVARNSKPKKATVMDTFHKSFSVCSDLRLTNDKSDSYTKLQTPSAFTPGMPTPSENATSKTHLSLHIPMDYGDNPYKTANLQTIVIVEESGNENEIIGDVVVVLGGSKADKIDSTTPLTASPM